MNKSMFGIYFFILCVFALLLGFTAYDTRGGTQDYTSFTNLQADSFFKVSDTGTPLSNLKWATLTLNNGATSGTVAVSGIDSTWKVLAVCKTAYTNAVYPKYTKLENGAVDQVMSGDPGTTLTYSVLLWK